MAINFGEEVTGEGPRASARSFTLPMLSSTPTYQDIMKTIGQMGQIPSLMDTAVPMVADIMGQQSQFLVPTLEGIDRQTNLNVADTQTDMMKRGLTGSDIEVGAMGSARGAGQMAKANVSAQFGMEQGKMLSSLIFRAMEGDMESERNLLTMLAQAMGQELTSQRDMAMFQKQLNAMDKESKRAFWGSVISGGMSAVGSVLGKK